MAQTPHKRSPEDEEDVKLEPLEVGVEPKLLAYLLDLKKMQGFGNSRSSIARSFIWKEVNRLLETGRLPPRE
jgi:hypothetical protein